MQSIKDQEIMASVEGRAGFAANRFGQDFRMLHISCDHQSSVSKKLKSGRPSSNSVNDHVHANSGWTPRNANSDKLPDMKWWLHGKTNTEGEENYTCQSLNSSASDLDAVYNGFLDDNIHLTPKKDQGEFYFLEASFVDNEKSGPWWRNAGKDELSSLVAKKSLEHIENCDFPQPQAKQFRTLPSSLNLKAETVSSNADSYTFGTSTSGSPFQDSNRNFGSSQTKDPSSSKKYCPINSQNNGIAKLMEALCHSQTRAREAEKAAQQAYNEKEHIVLSFSNKLHNSLLTSNGSTYFTFKIFAFNSETKTIHC